MQGTITIAIDNCKACFYVNWQYICCSIQTVNISLLIWMGDVNFLQMSDFFIWQNIATNVYRTECVATCKRKNVPVTFSLTFM